MVDKVVIQRIPPCQRDEEVRAQLAPSYKNKVVVKPWGWEFLIHETEQTATWYLRLNGDGAQTSMHCHQQKKTTLLVLSGSAVVTTFLRRDYLGVGDAVVIAPGVFHSTQAPFRTGAEIVEVETPPNKQDLLRMVDQYDREKQGYEQSFSPVNLDDYHRFNLSEQGQAFGNRLLRLAYYENQFILNDKPPNIQIPLSTDLCYHNCVFKNFLGEPIPDTDKPWFVGYRTIPILEFK